MISDLARRFPENPLLSPADLKPSRADFEIIGLFNPGVFRFNGKICLLLRVAERPKQTEGKLRTAVLDKNGEVEIIEIVLSDPALSFPDPRVFNWEGQDYLTSLSHLRVVSSDDGIHFKEDNSFPILTGKSIYETYGIEDCRVTETEDGRFLLTYTAVSPNGVAVGLRETRDWKRFLHHGLMLPPHNKDCCILSEKVNNHYFCYHRPSSPAIGGNYIWSAESPDLKHWGNHKCVLKPREGKWDSKRVGAGAASVKTEKGYLHIYHGADENDRYGLGVFLTDLDDPSTVIARSEESIMFPAATYEKEGFFNDVVFTNGHYLNETTGEIFIYYGAADQYICGARFKIKDNLTSPLPLS